MSTVSNSDQAVGGADAQNVQSLTTPGVTPTGTNTAVFVSAVGAINGATGNYPDEARFTNSSGGLINDYVGANQLLSYFSFSEAYAKIRGEVGVAVDSGLPIYVHWPNGNYSAAMTAVFLNGVHQTTPYGTEVVEGPGFLPSGTSAANRTLVFSGLNPGQRVIASIGFFMFGSNALGAITAGADTTILQDANAPAHEGRQVRIVTVTGVADGSGDITLTVSVTPTSNDDFIRYSFNGNPVNDAAGGGSPATVIVGGSAEPDAPGGLVVAPGTAASVVGGSQAREVAGGVISQPGVALVVTGGTAAREEAGGVLAAPGAVSLPVGGAREREAAGGVIAAAGVQTIVAGGTASAERGGGLIVLPGVATVVAGGVAEQSLSGGHQVVPGVIGITLGGTAQREQIGGLSAQIGVASLAVGGRDEQERPGGASVYGGAVQLQLGGVAELPRAGGLYMVDGTAPVAPTWPAGGTGRVGSRVLVDATERIGGKRLTGPSRRIG